MIYGNDPLPIRRCDRLIQDLLRPVLIEITLHRGISFFAIGL